MAPKLYMTNLSPPVRSVLLTAKALGVTLEEKEVDLSKGDHLTPEYLKLNPQHTVPTLEDNGYVIWDSHAIIAYLFGKYGKDDSLYPKEVTQRGIIDQRLHFDTGMAFGVLRSVVRPLVYAKTGVIPQEQLESINEVYDFLEKFLEGNQWIAGNKVTIADFSLIPTVTSLDVLVTVCPKKYPNITAWIKRAQAWPYYNVNAVGLDKFKQFISTMLKK